jgi:nucleoside-diphosphate-sugar epimerase
MAPRSVLVTGMSGLIGGALRRHLEGQYALSALNRQAPPTLRFDIFFAVSDNRWGYRDLEHARAVLGFEPRDRAEDHR